MGSIEVLNNPATFTSSFKFQITFDCVTKLEKELEWKLVYVGSADNEDNDQELDSILVGPVRVGKNRFIFEAPPPNASTIPEDDLLDVTVILLTCSYKEQEFIRIGYYVHNEYEEEIDENDENTKIEPNKIQRNILSDKPRVTRFNIAWDGVIAEKLNENAKNGGDETKENENDAQFEDEADLEHDVDEEESASDDEDLAEEDLADTELKDILKAEDLEKTETKQVDAGDEEDIDMTET